MKFPLVTIETMPPSVAVLGPPQIITIDSSDKGSDSDGIDHDEEGLDNSSADEDKEVEGQKGRTANAPLG